MGSFFPQPARVAFGAVWRMIAASGPAQVGRPDTGPCLDTYGKINAAGGDAIYLSLPKLPRTPLFDRIPQAGIWGNDHIMMWNKNSDQIAEILLKWIEKHVEKKGKK